MILANRKWSREEPKAGGEAVSGEKGARGRNREVSFCIVNNTLKTHK